MQKLKVSIVAFVFVFLLHIQAEATGWYTEMLYSDWRQTFLVDQKIYEEKTQQQELVIFENKTFGKVLVLDGVIQTTENDEFVYHEMIVHVPLLAHGNAKRVLIIGGGDGGVLREVLRHKTIERVVLVELDPSVIAFSKKYFPNHSKGAFDHPKVQIVIQDGSQFVKNTSEKFDVIICDSCDPTGPAAVLFSPEFFGNCQKALSEEGIFVNQNGVPLMQPDELINTYRNLKIHFPDVRFYLAVIPTYVGGFMSFGWGSNKLKNQVGSLKELQKRFKNIEGDLKYYSPAMHKASFVLPKFIKTMLLQEAASHPVL